MAKSLRSKWKRKMRAIKRERYAVKELDRLKMMLSKAENPVAVPDVTVVDNTAKIESNMEVETESKSKVNSRTLKNEHGNYPVWMNRRKIAKHKRLRNAKKPKKAKR